MKKFIAFCKSNLAEILFAFIVVIVFITCVWTLDVTWASWGVIWLLVIRSFLPVNVSKPQGPFCVPVNDADNADDPQPEPAEKLPYVYYDSPREQVAHTIRFYSPYLGKERVLPFRPRKARGKPFDNVRGIQVADKLVVLRNILFSANFPDDIREMAKQYEGRFPNRAEIELIYAKFNEINQNLYECGEPLLKRVKYLYTSGDETADKTMNYCLNFATGQESLADCDSLVGAVLVEKSTPDIQKLKEGIEAFKKQHLNKAELIDEFDVLCVVNDHKERLPFIKRYLGEPIGIFPFKADSRYIELSEAEDKKHTDKDVDTGRLLDKEFCDHVYLIKNRLNIYLKALDKPLLEGTYLADSSYMRGCGWIIGFDDNKFNTLSSDYYGGNQPAKLRYMGRF